MCRMSSWSFSLWQVLRRHKLSVEQIKSQCTLTKLATRSVFGSFYDFICFIVWLLDQKCIKMEILKITTVTKTAQRLPNGQYLLHDKVSSRKIIVGKTVKTQGRKQILVKATPKRKTTLVTVTRAG